MDRWIVARTQARRELWACKNIANQGAEYYLPLIASKLVRNGKVITSSKCLFPSYVFVRMVNGRWRFLLGTYGVLSVIMDGMQPAYMGDDAIQYLHSLESEDGLIHLADKPRKSLVFSVGDKVLFVDGPFQGCKGIYAGSSSKHCEKVLLELLGRKTTVVVESEHIISD